MAAVTLVQAVYKSSTNISQLTAAAACGHCSSLSSVVHSTAKFASHGEGLSLNTRQLILYVSGGRVVSRSRHKYPPGTTTRGRTCRQRLLSVRLASHVSAARSLPDHCADLVLSQDSHLGRFPRAVQLNQIQFLVMAYEVTPLDDVVTDTVHHPSRILQGKMCV